MGHAETIAAYGKVRRAVKSAEDQGKCFLNSVKGTDFGPFIEGKKKGLQPLMDCFFLITLKRQLREPGSCKELFLWLFALLHI